MMSSSHRNLICDTISELSSLTSVSQVGAKFAAAMAKLGFSAVGIGMTRFPKEEAAPVILTEVAPKGFRDLYNHERFYAVSHLVAYARVACEPFRYSDAPLALQASTCQWRYLQALESFGMGKGVIIPIGRPANIRSCAWLAGKNPELDDGAILVTQMMSLFAASKAQALSGSGEAFEESSTLTPREREVLQWIAAGKSAWEIGEILAITKRTVDEHAQTATRKLNASNRTQAVVLALRGGLITL